MREEEKEEGKEKDWEGGIRDRRRNKENKRLTWKKKHKLNLIFNTQNVLAKIEINSSKNR